MMMLIAGSMPYKFTIFFYFKALLRIMQERVASSITHFLTTPLSYPSRIVPDHADSGVSSQISSSIISQPLSSDLIIR